MFKVAIVLNKIVMNISYYDKYPELAPPIVIVDITNYKGVVKEGYVYDAASGKFTEPSDTVEPPSVEQPTEERTIEQRLEVIEMTVAYTQLQVDYTSFLMEILAAQPK